MVNECKQSKNFRKTSIDFYPCQLYGDFAIALSKKIILQSAVRRLLCSMNVVQPRILIVVDVLGSSRRLLQILIGVRPSLQYL